MKPSLIVAVLMGILLGACSVVSTASDNPFVLVEAEAITSPDTAMVIGAAHPGTGEQVGEIRWEVLEYRIALRNQSDETLTGLETGLVPSDAIQDLYGGDDPFAKSSGLRGHYGKWPEVFEVTPGEEVEIIRGIITYAHETDAARNVGSPLTRQEAGRLLEIADQVTLEVQWDGGSQRFDLEDLIQLHTSPRGTADSSSDDTPVFQINRTGGFAVWGHAGALVPLLTLWADGRVVFVEPDEQYGSDQTLIRAATLDPAIVEGLLEEARMLFDLEDRYSAFSFTDLGYTTFSIETEAGRKTVMVYGLSLELSPEWRDQEQHQDVMDQLRSLFQSVSEALPDDAPALRPAEVTVVARPHDRAQEEPAEPEPTEVAPEWPPELVGHLTGEKAAQAVELLPPGPVRPFLLDGKPHRITVVPVLPLLSLPSLLWSEDGLPRHPAATAYHLRHGVSSGAETQYRFGGVDEEEVASCYREAMSERGWELVKEADGLQVWVRQEYHNDPIVHLHFILATSPSTGCKLGVLRVSPSTPGEFWALVKDPGAS